MKTLRFIGMAVLMAVVSFGFTACSGDDGDSASASKIEGVWNLTNSTGEECGDSWNENIPQSFTEGAYRVTFNSDGTFLAERYDERDGWYSSGWYLECSEGHYEVGDGKLYLKEDSYDAEVYTIKSFSGNKMVLHTEWHDCDEPCWVDYTFKKKK